MEAALRLFMEQGYQKTSIAGIETEAGLVPRAGAFYRHFESKQSLLEELARTHVSETPASFGLDTLADFGDTRAELITIARNYEEAMARQQPFARLIEEVRLLDFGAGFQEELDRDMMQALSAWTASKPAAHGLSDEQLAALVFNVFGSWLYYLSMVHRGPGVEALRDVVLEEWAARWSTMLDQPAD